MALSQRSKFAAQGAEPVFATLVIPAIPNVPPPTDPRLMPQWYERWWQAMERWRQQTNHILQSTKG